MTGALLPAISWVARSSIEKPLHSVRGSGGPRLHCDPMGAAGASKLGGPPAREGRGVRADANTGPTTAGMRAPHQLTRVVTKDRWSMSFSAEASVDR